MRVALAVCMTLMPLLPVHRLMASGSHFHRCGPCLWSFHRVSRVYMECATKFQGMMQVMDARHFSKGPLDTHPPRPACAPWPAWLPLRDTHATASGESPLYCAS